MLKDHKIPLTIIKSNNTGKQKYNVHISIEMLKSVVDFVKQQNFCFTN